MRGESELRHERRALILLRLSSMAGPNQSLCNVGTAQGNGSALTSSGFEYGLLILYFHSLTMMSGCGAFSGISWDSKIYFHCNEEIIKLLSYLWNHDWHFYCLIWIMWKEPNYCINCCKTVEQQLMFLVSQKKNSNMLSIFLFFYRLKRLANSATNQCCFKNQNLFFIFPE